MKPQMTRWFEIISSMRTTVILLIILGIAASLGTLVPQGVSPASLIQHYGVFLGKILLVLGFDHLYSSWWFLLLGGLLGLNITFCSLQRLKSIKDASEAGSILIHLSILVIFIGSAITGLLGTSADVNIAVGETRDLTEKGFPGYAVKVEDFRIEYYDTLEPRQYLSKLALEQTNGEKVLKEIKVNSPLKHNGIKIYQQSYGWQVKGVLIHNDENQRFQLYDGGELILNAHGDLVIKTIFIPFYDEHTGSMRSLSPIPKNPHLACALIQGSDLIDVKFLAPGDKAILGDHHVQFDDYRYYSGLNIKKDPGIPWIYSGFGIMILGFTLRYAASKRLLKG